MNTFFRFVALCSLLTIWPFSGQTKELKVGVGLLNYPPYYFEEEGAMKGAVLEVTQHIVDELGHTLVFEKLPWSRIQHHLRLGSIDMVVLSFKTPDREKYATFTDTPHIYDTSYLFIKKTSQIEFDGNLNNMRDYHFGNIRGYSHGIKYDEANQLNKQFASEEKQLIQMLLHNRIDVAIGNKAVITAHAKEEGVFEQLVFLNPPIDNTPAYFAFAKIKIGSNKLAHEFSEQVKALVKTEKYQQILDKYGL